MQSTLRKDRRLTSALMLAMLAGPLSACATQREVIRPASACSTLVPGSWRSGVPSAPVPAGNTAGEWVKFGDAQTSRLDAANSRTVDTLGIVEACESRDKEVVEQLTGRSLWQRITPWRE